MEKPILLRELEERVNGRKWGEFVCVCGIIYRTNLYDVEHGKSRNCGCVRREKCRVRRYKHGETKTPLYSRWASMHQRCRPNADDRKHYYDKGIKVCKRWNNYLNFKSDMSVGFQKRLTLDRIDNSKGYSPSNCRWVTWTQQQNNKSDNVIFEYKDKYYTMAQLAKVSVVSYSTLNSRLRLSRHSRINWTVEMAVETPALTTGKRKSLY